MLTIMHMITCDICRHFYHTFLYFIMKKVTDREVHIIPLGYEIDRAIRPFDDRKVDLVHLISMDSIDKYSSDIEQALTKKQLYFDQSVIKFLEKLGIEVITHHIDMFDILSVMALISQIIKDEHSKNSNVSVNMSACGRLTSFAVTQAAMAHHVQLYYVRADSYSQNQDETNLHGLSICNSCRIWDLENFKYDLPSGLDRVILMKITQNQNELSGEDLLFELINEKINGYETKFWELPIRERRKCAPGTITCIKEYCLSLQKKDIISIQYNDDGDNYRE